MKTGLNTGRVELRGWDAINAKRRWYFETTLCVNPGYVHGAQRNITAAWAANNISNKDLVYCEIDRALVEIMIREQTLEEAEATAANTAYMIRWYGILTSKLGIDAIEPWLPWSRNGLDDSDDADALRDLVEACREVWGNEYAERQKMELGL